MSDTHRRVYHPTLNAWQDVPTKDADKWKAGGWRLTAPSHVDEKDAPAPGEHPGIASVPVLEDTSPTTTGTATTARTTGTTATTTGDTTP